MISLDAAINPSQQQAIAHALAAEDVAIIHGPPGTGKTTAVVELIRQAVQRGEKVLACAPSNLAVDNIFERLLAVPELAVGANVVRIGHPARVLPALRDQTLDLLVENHPDMKLVRKLTKEAHALRAGAGKFTHAKPEPGARRDMRQEAKALLADARRLEAQLVERIFGAARVICATLSGLDERLLGDYRFDRCVIDEAAQSSEPGCWIPLRYSQRLVLAGDHCQLPPTVISPEAGANGLGVSLMERLLRHEFGEYPKTTPPLARQGSTDPGVGYRDLSIPGEQKKELILEQLPVAVTLACQLDIQYRMHQQIMEFSSQTFYGGTLLAHSSVESHLLAGLPGVQETELTSTSVNFIDMAGAAYQEALEPEGESRFNEGEARLVLAKITQLHEAGLPFGHIAVISPYSAQVRLLRERLAPLINQGLEIGSIDGFQGRENEAVIISLVRSNDDGEIGFLVDTRRMNVALTRARRKLIVIGDSATIAGHPFYSQLLDYFEKINAYHTVWEENL